MASECSGETRTLNSVAHCECVARPNTLDTVIYQLLFAFITLTALKHTKSHKALAHPFAPANKFVINKILNSNKRNRRTAEQQQQQQQWQRTDR